MMNFNQKKRDATWKFLERNNGTRFYRSCLSEKATLAVPIIQRTNNYMPVLLFKDGTTTICRSGKK